MSQPATQFTDNPSVFQIMADAPGDNTGKVVSCQVKNSTLLMISADYASVNGRVFTGKVGIIFNTQALNSTLSRFFSNVTDTQYIGEETSAYLGFSMACDSNGNMAWGSIGFRNAAGAGYFKLGNFTTTGIVDLLYATRPLIFRVTGENPGDNFGYSSLLVTGFDNSTNTQVVFCAPNFKVDWGRCYVLWFPEFLQGPEIPLQNRTMSQVLFIDGAPGMKLGSSLTSYIDENGLPTIVIGASQANQQKGTLFSLKGGSYRRQQSTFNVTSLVPRGMNGSPFYSNWTGGQLGISGMTTLPLNGRTVLAAGAPTATFQNRPIAGITAIFDLNTTEIICTMGGDANSLFGYSPTMLNLGANSVPGLAIGAPWEPSNNQFRSGIVYYVPTLCQNTTLDLAINISTSITTSVDNNIILFRGSNLPNKAAGQSITSLYFDSDNVQDLVYGEGDAVFVIKGDVSPIITNTTIYLTQNNTRIVTFIKVTWNGQLNPNVKLLLQTSNGSYFSLTSNPLRPITNCTFGQQQTNQLLLTTGESRVAPNCSIAAASPRGFAANAAPIICDIHFSLRPPRLINNTVFGYIGQALPVTTDNIGPTELGLDTMPDETIIYFSPDSNSKFCKGADPNPISSCTLRELKPGNSSITFTPLSTTPAVSVTVFDPVNNLISDPFPLTLIVGTKPVAPFPPHIIFDPNDVSKIFTYDALGDGSGAVGFIDLVLDSDNIEIRFFPLNNYIANRLLPALPITSCLQKDIRQGKIADYLPMPARQLFPNISLSVQACTPYACSDVVPMTMTLAASSSSAVLSSSSLAASSSSLLASSSSALVASSSAVAEAAGAAAMGFPTWTISLVTTPIGLGLFYARYRSKNCETESARTLKIALGKVAHPDWDNETFRAHLFTPLIDALFEVIDTRKCLRVRDDATNLAYFSALKNIIDKCKITAKYFMDLNADQQGKLIETIVDCIVFYASRGLFGMFSCGKPSMSPERLVANSLNIINDMTADMQDLFKEKTKSKSQVSQQKATDENEETEPGQGDEDTDDVEMQALDAAHHESAEERKEGQELNKKTMRKIR